MPTIIVETGDNIAGANAYVDPAGQFATDYFAGHLYASGWNSATTGTRESAVIMATRTLDDGVNWLGVATNDDQALRWPRIGMHKEARIIDDDVIPDDIKRASLELALQLIARNRTDPDATTPETKKISLGKGAVELEFVEGTSAAAGSVTVLPDSVWRMVRYYGSPIGSRGSKVLRVVK